jgi:hypothetical protein
LSTNTVLGRFPQLRQRSLRFSEWMVVLPFTLPPDSSVIGISKFCLPGVKLTDVRSGRGDDPGPAAA